MADALSSGSETRTPEFERTINRLLNAAPRLDSKLLWPAIPILRGARRFDDADYLMTCIERADGESVRSLEERARLAFARGDHETVLALLSARCDRSPSATARIAIARFHLETGNLPEAVTIAGELGRSDGTLVSVKQLAADVSRAIGDIEGTRAYYLALVDERQEHPPSLFALAALSLDEGDEESARAFYRRALVSAGDGLTPSMMSAAAEVAARLGSTDEADAFRAEVARAQAEKLERSIAELAAALDEANVPAEPSPAARTDRSSTTPTVPTSPLVRQRKHATPAREHVVALQADHVSAFVTDPRVMTTLRSEFGHETLRSGQAAVIEQVLAGEDTLAIMPTGAGKSLTFQLPSMLGDKPTVVVSPLIALMKDQVDSLPDSVRSRTALINSTLSQSEMRDRLDQLARGDLKLVYVAPERLRNYGFLRSLREAGIARVVVDEAHCVSMWGHDFRPDYLFIPRAVAELGNPPILAITATATPDMVEQIAAGLGRTMSVVRTSVFRPNLTYEVHQLEKRDAKLERIVQICKAERGCGIVYVSSRRDTESIAAMLRDRGVHALPYHAGLDPSVRADHQDRFMTGRARVIVATVAFGMGVNKADVRFIVHLVAPRSLEAYAQESGRAGRDGEPARCILLVSPHDRQQLVQNARRDEMEISQLRRVYGQLMRQARGPWVILDAASLRPPDEQDDADPKIALGILEQADLLRRHPDAPYSYEIRRVPRGLEEPDVVDPDFERLARHFPETWTSRGSAVINTADLAAASGFAPADIDRLLQSLPAVSAREGQRAMCLHLNPVSSDAGNALQAMLDRARDQARDRIEQVMAYAMGSACRHAALAAHLGERLEPCGTSCDVCRGKAEQPLRKRAAQPATRTAITAGDALLVLEALRELPFPVGKTGLTKLLSGSVDSRIREDRSPAFGTLKDFSKTKIDALIDRLIDEGFIRRDMAHEYKLLSLSARGEAARLSDLAEFNEAVKFTSSDAGGLDPADSRLYERLADWRRAKALEESVPPYVVAHNNMLRNLAASRPATTTALMSVPGFGSSRVQKYGAELLQVISASDDSPPDVRATEPPIARNRSQP